jgi:hypothetical protein
MSKKKSKSKAESVKTEEMPAVVEPQAVATEPADVSGKPMFNPQNLDPVLSIADAASRHIQGYQPRWLPALNAYAKTLGVDASQPQATSTWKNVFKQWGAILK